MDFNSPVPPLPLRGASVEERLNAGGDARGKVSDPRSTLTNLHLILAEA